MALDRTWYNSLVDDDGSGLTGSIWDKADVDALMDAIDAEFTAQLEAAWTAFTPQLYATAGVWSASGPLMRWRRNGTTGKQLSLQYSIEGGTLSASTGSLAIQLPVAAAAWAGIPANPCVIFLPTGLEIASASIPASKNVLDLYRVGTAAFPAGTFTVRGQLTYEIP
jgi:hypothetical protein